MPPVITLFYAGVFGFMAIAIAFIAGRRRGTTGVSIGHGDDPLLHLAMRRHANFIEFVPLGLIVIGLLELNGVGPLGLHALGAGLLAFRVAHAVGINTETVSNPLRGIGAGGSTLVLAVGSAWALWLFATS